MAANAWGSAAHTATRRRTYRNAYNYVTLSAFLDLASHCHSTSSVPKRYVQARVAVPTTRGCALRAEWQCRPHCHSTSNVLAARPHTATRRRTYQDGALGPEWQCRPRGAARSGPSGSAAHTATRRRTYQDGASKPEWQCPPHGTARSGPSGSTPSHCHSTSNVPKMSRWLPMTSRTRRRWPSRARCPVTPASRGP